MVIGACGQSCSAHGGQEKRKTEGTTVSKTLQRQPPVTYFLYLLRATLQRQPPVTYFLYLLRAHSAMNVFIY
jgi:hypothetical protein